MVIRQYKNPEFRFCKVLKRTKRPFEKDWTKKLYKWDEIQSHIKNQKNFGVLCGYGGLIVIDSDEDRLLKVIDAQLPKTFRVRTGSGGVHDYYICKDLTKKIILEDEKGHLGEVQSFGAQVVGANSIHPSGNTYKIEQDLPIKEISFQQLMGCISPFIKELKKVETVKQDDSKRGGSEDINSIDITSVLDTTGFNTASNGELFGSNPYHGSSGGMNTWINQSKNVGYCFRCNSHLTVAKCIGLNENIISNCSDYLTRDQFIKVLNIAKEKYGLKSNVVETAEVMGLTAKSYERSKQIKEGKTIEPQSEIFFEVKDILKKYLDTTEENYNLITIWIIGTYYHDQCETFPLLTLLARKQSGKTRTLKLMSALSKGSDGSTSTSITETYLFRHKGGALFFDEMESISSKDKSTLRETINAIYKKGNKIIRYRESRKDGSKDYEEQCFYPFYPLALANIYGFGDVLADRSLQLILRRSKNKQSKLIEDFSTNDEIINIRNKLNGLNVDLPKKLFSNWNNFVTSKNYDSTLKKLFETISKTKLTARPLELSFPLFVVADQFDVLDLVIDSMIDYVDSREGDQLDNIDDILQTFMDAYECEGFKSVSDILKDFKNSLEEKEDWMNSKWFGRALKRLGLVKKKRIINGRVQVELNKNSINTTNTINSTNSTNSTNIHNNKQVEFVDSVEFVERSDKIINNKNNQKVPPFCVTCGSKEAFIVDKGDTYCKDCIYGGKE